MARVQETKIQRRDGKTERQTERIIEIKTKRDRQKERKNELSIQIYELRLVSCSWDQSAVSWFCITETLEETYSSISTSRFRKRVKDKKEKERERIGMICVPSSWGRRAVSWFCITETWDEAYSSLPRPISYLKSNVKTAKYFHSCL